MTDLIQHNPTSVALLPAPTLPREIAWALEDSKFRPGGPWEAGNALSVARSHGVGDRLQAWADELEASLAPASPQWLMQRVRNLGLAFGHEKDPDRATIWIHETARLLRDLPADIVNDAIDEAVTKSERGFLPSVGEIRKIAEPMLETRKVQARRMAVLARDQANFVERPALPLKDDRLTPEAIDEIMREHRIPSVNLRPPEARELHNPTVADYVALGLTEEQARAAVRSLLPQRKSQADPAKPIGQVASEIVD